MTEKRKPALLVAQQNGRWKRDRLHRQTPLPTLSIKQEATTVKREELPLCCWKEQATASTSRTLFA